jgi:hypothetical protein
MSSSKKLQHTGFFLIALDLFLLSLMSAATPYLLPMSLLITDGDAPQGRLVLAT